MHLFRAAVIVLVCGGLCLLAPPSAFACSCAEAPSPHISLDAASAVFRGTVVAIDVPGGEVVSSADPKRVTFAVGDVWKGPAYTQLVVTTARDGASCGFPFELKQEYLVYASGPAAQLRTGLCGRTRATADPQSAEDFAALGSGTVPKESPPAAPAPSPPPAAATPTAAANTPDSGAMRNLALIFGAGLALLIGALVLRKKS